MFINYHASPAAEWNRELRGGGERGFNKLKISERLQYNTMGTKLPILETTGSLLLILCVLIQAILCQKSHHRLHLLSINSE